MGSLTVVLVVELLVRELVTLKALDDLLLLDVVLKLDVGDVVMDRLLPDVVLKLDVKNVVGVMLVLVVELIVGELITVELLDDLLLLDIVLELDMEDELGVILVLVLVMKLIVVGVVGDCEVVVDRVDVVVGDMGEDVDEDVDESAS
ncbi:MAG: hypothetical protein Q9181_002949 [Wetmoreana brouardii]